MSLARLRFRAGFFGAIAIDFAAIAALAFAGLSVPAFGLITGLY